MPKFVQAAMPSKFKDRGISRWNKEQIINGFKALKNRREPTIIYQCTSAAHFISEATTSVAPTENGFTDAAGNHYLKPRLFWTYNDGGKIASSYSRKRTGDCVCRAIAIATKIPYREVQNIMWQHIRRERKGKHKKNKSHPMHGVHKPTIHRILKSLGWKWHPTTSRKQGCTNLLHTEKLPKGAAILSLARHTSAVMERILHDTCDWSQKPGERTIYGYWKKETHAS